VADWNFLTGHTRVLPCFAHDPGVRLRDTAARTGVTERTGYGIVTDLTEAGYVVKHKDGPPQPLPDPGPPAAPGRVRYQATVAAMASASGVPARPKTDSHLVMSSTNGSSNW
jgi:hypothetical protein